MDKTILLQRLVEHASEQDNSELQKLVEQLGVDTSDLIEEKKSNYKKEEKDGDYEGDDEGDYEGDYEGDDSVEKMEESLNRLMETLDKSTEEDFKKIIEEQGFSTDFLNKTQALMESALNARKRALKTELEEKYETLAESYINEQVLPAIDDYLSYVAEEYIRENEEQVAGNARVQIAENFLTGLKDLFEQNNVEVPESKEDVVEEQEKELQKMRSELNEEIRKSKQLTESLQDEKRKNILRESSEDLTVNEANKLEELAEDVKFEDEESFKSKIQSLKETYFRSTNDAGDNSVTGTGRTEEPQNLEESQSSTDGDNGDPEVKALNEQLTKMFGKNARF